MYLFEIKKYKFLSYWKTLKKELKNVCVIQYKYFYILSYCTASEYSPQTLFIKFAHTYIIQSA